MDPITHAASGALAMLALPSRPATRWAVPLAALAASAPDLDVLCGWSPLLALQTHRGFTHALAFAPLWGLLLALLMFPLWRRKKDAAGAETCAAAANLATHCTENSDREPAAAPSAPCAASSAGLWRFRTVWGFAVCMLVLHIWLDAVTTYGTLALLPFSDFRVRGNALFIIDIWLTMPLLAALLLRRRPAAVLAGLLWVFFYPAGMIAVHEWHSIQANAALRRAENVVLPDVLAPLRWRVLSQQDGVVRARGMDWRGRLEAPDTTLPAAPAPLLDALAAQDASCLAFRRFSLLPVLRHEEDGAWLLYDLRFGTSQPWVRDMMPAFIRQPSPFQLRAQLRPDGSVEAARLQYAAKDSGWQPPRAPLPQGWGAAFGLY